MAVRRAPRCEAFVTVVAYTLDVLLVASAAYSLAVTLVASRFGRPAARSLPEHDQPDAPGVSILVPLAGAEPHLGANLAAYCRLRYRGPVQLVVGSLEPHDPGLAIARHVAGRHRGVDICIVAGASDVGPNRKVALLAALARAARYPVLTAVDSDVRVGPDYLARLVPELGRPGVGLVTCYYRAPSPRTLAQAYEALCINADFSPAVMLASAIGRSDFAFGATLMLRRETLDAIGGFTALVEYLADDHRMAELVTASGRTVVTARYVVESDPNPVSIGAALRHQLRWARTTRSCAPWGYAANVITHGTTFAVLSLLPGMPLAFHRAVLAALVLALRMVAAVTAIRSLGARPGHSLWLVPARDLIATMIWAASFVGDRVEWRGRYYHLRRDGRLVPEVHGARELNVEADEAPARAAVGS